LAKNLLDELDCQFIISTKYLADLMFILMKLINIFQKEYVSFADIKLHLDATYDAITAQFIGFMDLLLHMAFVYKNIVCKILIFYQRIYFRL